MEMSAGFRKKKYGNECTPYKRKGGLGGHNLTAKFDQDLTLVKG